MNCQNAAATHYLKNDTSSIHSGDCKITYPNNENSDSRAEKFRALKQVALPWLFLSISAVSIGLHEIYRTKDGDYDRSLEPNLMLHNAGHKELFPLSRTDYVGFTCAMLGLMVAGGGGIGGGGILVPIYILVMNFSPKQAIPLANVTVLGGAIANTIMNSMKRHPFANRPLVDWDLIMVMEPLTIGGSLIGAFLNKLLPEQLLVIMLVALLSFTSKTTLQKALKMYRKESEEMLKAVDGKEKLSKQPVSNKNASMKEIESLLDSKQDHYHSLIAKDGNANAGSTQDGKTIEETLNKILDEESRTPTKNVLLLFSMFAVVMCINIMKGGGALPSPLGIVCGSFSFWLSNISMLVWVMFIMIIARNYLVKRNDLKKEVKYPYVEGDIEWDSRATIVYPSVCCLAGLFAGMFGVGGGIVKGPLMLAMGVHPAVSSATSACMILFTSSTATTSYFVFGLLIPDYATICFVMGIVGTFMGQMGLYFLMRKFNRNSFIAFSIGFVVLLSSMLMTVQIMMSQPNGGTQTHPGGVCGGAMG